MSNRNSLKRLLGIGAFVCCSVILLGVTAHSARNEQLPSVSELGTIVTDPLGFVREQPVPPALPAASAELDPSAEPDEAGEAEAQTEEPSGQVPAAGEENFVFLPDLTDPGEAEDTENGTRGSAGTAVSAVVIEDEAGGVSSTLSLPTAEMQSASVSGGKDEPEVPPEQTDAANKDEDEPSGGKEEPSGSAEAEAPAGKTEETEKDPEAGSAAPSDEQTGDDGAEPAEEAEGPAEEDDGEEELVAVAAVTLSLKTDDKHHQEYLHGYDDGTARPGGKITRAEACQILFNLLERKPGNRQGLKDVSDDAWYAEPVRLLAAYSIIDCPDGKARPTDNMTRAELVSALYRLVSAGSASASAQSKSDFSDVPASHPYAGAIAAAVKLGWVNGYEDGTFHPDGSITRAETAKVVNRALNRMPDSDWIDENIKEPIYPDLTTEHWAYYELTEASVAHDVLLKSGAETWNPAETKEPASEETQTAEAEGIGSPKKTGWADEELERMLNEPLPEPVDEDLLFFEGFDLYARDGKDGKLKNATLGRYLTFGKDGSYTSGDKELDKKIKDILEEITHEGMTREEMLNASYIYVRDNFFYRRRNFYETGETGWEADEALTMFTTEKGNCYNFASAFAMLARQLGYDAEAVSGLVGSELQAHGWVEIIRDGERLLYDPTLESSYRDKGFDFDFFGIPYAAAPWPYHKR